MNARDTAPAAPTFTRRRALPRWATHIVALALGGGVAAVSVLVFANPLPLLLLMLLSVVAGSAWLGGLGPGLLVTFVGIGIGGYYLMGVREPRDDGGWAVAEVAAFFVGALAVAALGEARVRAQRAHAATHVDTAARIAQGEHAAREQAHAAIAEGEQRANAAIAANEARFRALIAHSADAFVLLDGSDAVRFASPAASRLLGLDSERERGVHLAALVHREDRSRLRVLRTESGQATVRLWASGSWRWVAATGSDLRDDPAIRAVLVNFHDITTQVRAGERDAFLREATHQLLAGERDAETFAAVAGVAVPRFAAGCAVELMDEGGALRRAFTRLPLGLPPDAPDPFTAAGVSAQIVRSLVTGRAATFAPAPAAPAHMLVVPLAARGRALGAVTFAASERGPFDADDEATATLFAGSLGLALVSVRP